MPPKKAAAGKKSANEINVSVHLGGHTSQAHCNLLCLEIDGQEELRGDRDSPKRMQLQDLDGVNARSWSLHETEIRLDQ